jgi:hypothetical protein
LIFICSNFSNVALLTSTTPFLSISGIFASPKPTRLFTFSVVLETPEDTFLAVWQPVHAMTVLKRRIGSFTFIVISYEIIILQTK